MEGASLPRYKCHKEVGALKIQHVLFWEDGKATITFAEPEFGPVVIGADYVRKHFSNPDILVGGYFVVYDDGYQSFSLAKAFEEGYTRIEP